MNVQLRTECGRKAELAAGREKGRDREVKECGGRTSEDVVATFQGCFQPLQSRAEEFSASGNDRLGFKKGIQIRFLNLSLARNGEGGGQVVVLGVWSL